ncbi:MAG: hypothetical protein AB7O24_28420 [Kofleriaceae bacterium]
MSLRIVVLSLVIACSGSGANAPGPDPAETPPTTLDPGATEDRSPMPPTPIGPEAQRGAGAAATKQADGAACMVGTECASGVCEGEGCGEAQPGKCMPADRACTKDLREYCGCDGKTFRSSGSCPGQRFRARADCKAP